MTSRLIVLSGPSGTGKTTLCNLVLENYPTIDLSVSTTTRGRRPDEKEGINYFFVSEEEFKREIEAGEFVEWAVVHNHHYGTQKKTIEKAFQRNRHLLFDIDVQGAMALRKLYPKESLLIFIKPPSMEELKRRLIERKGDSSRSIETRLQNAYNEIKWSPKFDHQITNTDLTHTFQQLQTILKKEGL